MKSTERPYVLFVAEKIYLEISKIRKDNLNFSNIDAVKKFIGSNLYKEVSSGKFHDKWFKKIEKNNFIDPKTKSKISQETIKLLQLQQDVMVKQLIQFPNLYYTKNNIPLEITQRAFDHLWRVCETYELWCKETKQKELLKLHIID